MKRTLFILSLSLVSLGSVRSAKAGEAEDLISFWHNRIGVLASHQKPYALLASDVDPSSDAGETSPIVCDEIDPIEQMICEEEAAQQQPGVPTRSSSIPAFFKVYPLSSEYADLLYQRLINLQSFLNRIDRYYKYRGQLPPAQQEEALRSLEQQSVGELLLASLRLYYAEPGLSSKCTRIKSANSVYARLDNNGSFTALSEHVERIFNQLNEGTFVEIENPSICRAIEESSRQAQIDRITELASSMVENRVLDNMAIKEHAISEAVIPVNSLVNRLQGENGNSSIRVLTDELFQLQLKIENASANMTLIHQDRYDISSTLANYMDDPSDFSSGIGTQFKEKVQEVYSQGPGVVSSSVSTIWGEYNKNNSYLTQLITSLHESLSAACSQDSNNCLSSCDILYANLDLSVFAPPEASSSPSSLDPGEELVTLRERFTSCMIDLANLAQTNSQLPIEQQLQLAFAREFNNYYQSVLSQLN